MDLGPMLPPCLSSSFHLLLLGSTRLNLTPQLTLSRAISRGCLCHQCHLTCMLWGCALAGTAPATPASSYPRRTAPMSCTPHSQVAGIPWPKIIAPMKAGYRLLSLLATLHSSVHVWDQGSCSTASAGEIPPNWCWELCHSSPVS